MKYISILVKKRFSRSELCKKSLHTISYTKKHYQILFSGNVNRLLGVLRYQHNNIFFQQLKYAAPMSVVVILVNADTVVIGVTDTWTALTIVTKRDVVSYHVF